jgi:hypothetical protein
VDAMMKASTNVGLGSEKAHWTKLLRDHDAGFPLPEGVDIEAIRETVKGYEPFEPPMVMGEVWLGFWQMRNTKSYDTPINHTDVYYFMKVMGFRLDNWEVRAIFALDRAWYTAYAKYNK